MHSDPLRTLFDGAFDAARHSVWGRALAAGLGVDRLVALLGGIEPERVARTVEDVRTHLGPDVPTAALVDELVRRKALAAAALAFATGLLPPGVALAAALADALVLLGLELELVFEIACAGGCDPAHPDRRLEALVVLAGGLGAGRAADAGAGLARQALTGGLSHFAIDNLARLVGCQTARALVAGGVPVVGAALGAGMGAAQIALVGRAAAVFYAREAGA